MTVATDDEPLTVTAGFNTDQRGYGQLPVKSLGFTVAVAQLALGRLSRFGTENRNLLPN
jgi:hypothetical protein